ncbi:transmembrane protein 213 [Discoglossus pictus]
MKTSMYLLLILSALCELSSGSFFKSGNSTESVAQPQCPEEDICTVASRCCVTGMDSYGWIAAAVGWSLLFLTLIILCIGKVMDLRPDEPKYMEA